MALILSENPTGKVLSWKVSPTKVTKQRADFRHTNSFKVNDKTSRKLVLNLKRVSRDELNEVGKWVVASAQVQEGEILCLILKPADKKAPVEILQIKGQAMSDSKDIEVLFLSPSDKSEVTGRKTSPFRQLVAGMQEAALD